MGGDTVNARDLVPLDYVLTFPTMNLVCGRCGGPLPAGTWLNITADATPLHLECPRRWEPTVITGDGSGEPTLPLRSLRAVEPSRPQESNHDHESRNVRSTP
jgi:hypothetical protein